MKRDPESYESELELVYKQFNSSLDLFQQQAALSFNSLSGIGSDTTVAKDLGERAMFLAHMTQFYPKHLSAFPTQLVDLLKTTAKSLPSSLRCQIVQALILLTNRNNCRCIKVTDQGLQFVLQKCSLRQSLNLYALSSLTNEAYKKIALLNDLRFLDLCGAQNLSDQALACIAKCRNLTSLNLTWYIAEGCTYIELLSLFGLVGVTDESIEALAKSCSKTLKTLDVNGCINIKKRTRDEFPHLECFKVHS